jgi:GNAT superfamily N-acetyltransferase
MRMHRFYVHPSYRRLGLGSRLAREVMTHALSHASVLICNARASAAAAPFWEALGFAKADGISYTHIFRAGMN